MFKNQGIMKCLNSIEKRKKWENPLVFSNMKDLGSKMLPILFVFFTLTSINSQVVVSLGDDIAICKGDDVQLSDLNPSITGSNGSKWWQTYGDGIFSASNNYPSAVTYTPGPSDIAAGEVEIYLKAILLPSGTVFDDVVTVYIQDDELFACNDKVIIPLNFHCEFKVLPPFVLEGENEDEPYNLYDVKIYDEDGDLVPDELLTKEYVGQQMTYNVTHQCSWNACGGIIIVKDNYHPIIDCENDTVTCMESTEPESLGFPIDTAIFDLDTIYKTGSQKYVVEGWDACGDVNLSYVDSITLYNCETNDKYQEMIIRFWKAVDESNNISRCHDSIFIERITLDSVLLPPSWNNVDTNALQCDGDWLLTALPNGNPSPSYTGAPELWSCTDIEYSYNDEEFPGCGNTFDVVRKWTMVDWCTSEIRHYNQVIKIMDTLAPVMVCNEDVVVVGADPYECNSVRYEIEIPLIEDNCGGYSLFVHVFNDATNEEMNVEKVGGKYFVEHLPLGLYKVKLTAIDDCNNKTECFYYFEVIDDEKPYAICDQHTKVNLGSNGEARLYPDNVDDGSFDNCEIVDMEIRKMTYDCDSSYFEFGEFVGFCCVESGDTIGVEMKVIDASGNFNSCMVEVIVEDKLPPQIICPPDIIVSCDFYFDPNDLGRYFGTVVTDESLREDIVINDYYNNGVVGEDGFAYDNCDVTVTPSEEFDVNNCNIGEIYRTFTATDNGGRTNPCLQTITIYNPEPFNLQGNDIIWPNDATFIGCSNLEADTAITGAPLVNDNMCSMVAMRYDDQMFSVQEDACEKIVRTWTVRDWCQSDEIKWTHDQIIMLNNVEAPVFTSDCEDREICVYGECSGLVELTASATDECTDEEELVWRWKLDIDKDGVYDEFGQGNHFSKTMYEGVYEIAWVVEDKCGNSSYCNYDFTVKDCKNPTPYCISDLTTVVMNQVGMVTVQASDFDHGSYDNCTPSNYGACGCETDLLFSFTEDVNDTLYNITCDSLVNGVARTFYLKMWVTDNAGNQDYCLIQLQVQDNNGVCPDSDGLVMGGLMSKWTDDAPVRGVDLELVDSDLEADNITSSTSNGRYVFNNIQSSDNYIVRPQDDPVSCVKGVSTSDIVKIQKHILGIKKFTSPYQYIAADANKSKSISASDILDIRKLILGSATNYPKQDCWVYADAKQNLTTYNPYDYTNELVYNNLNTNVNDANFKVIKVGDVNDSHNPQQMPQNLVFRNDALVSLDLDDLQMIAGNNYKVPVYIKAENGLEGIQFTIDFNLDNVMFNGYEESQIELGDNNFGFDNIERGLVTFSWNTFTNKSIDSKSPAFYLNFTVKESGLVSHNVNINSQITEALSIVNDEELPIAINYRNNGNIEEFAVYQNTPNPFNDKTTIRFNLPQDGTVTLDIFDINGKLVHSRKAKFNKGINQLIISDTDLKVNGVFYYTLKVDGGTITKKMILID